MSAHVPVLAAVLFVSSGWGAELPPREAFQAYFDSVCGANRVRTTADGLEIDVRLVPSYQCFLCLDKALQTFKAGKTPDLEDLRQCYWQGRLLGKQAVIAIGLRNPRFRASAGIRTVYLWRRHPNRDTFTLEGKSRIAVTRLVESPKEARDAKVRMIQSFRGSGDDLTPVYGRAEEMHLIEGDAVEYRVLVPLDRLEREREKELVLTISGLSSYSGPFVEDTMNGVHNPAREVKPIEVRIPLPIRAVAMPDPMKALLAEIEKNPPKSS